MLAPVSRPLLERLAGKGPAATRDPGASLQPSKASAAQTHELKEVNRLQ